MKKMLKLLIHPLLLAIIGLIALAAIIWFAGPLIALANWRPLESETVRLIVIVIMVLAWLAKKAWTRWKTGRTNSQMMDGLLKSAPPAAGPSASEAEVRELSKRFEEAIGVLKKVHVGAAGKKPGLRDLLSLSGRQYLYQIPWYIVIGAPGAGKTVALVNSGLQFPLEEKFGTKEIRGVGGTRNCDWFFTDEAVLIDTAGRWTTQESDHEVDSAAWQGFLQLLKKFRPRRPVNGVILAISVSDLLQESSQEREKHAAKLRARLQELHEQFQTRFPIYVLVTKTDLLAGFSEFYSEFGKEDRAQVWGMTVPYSPDAGQAPLANFAAEYELLEQRLLDRVLDRMQGERDPAKRALIFAFPQQFATVKPLLTGFLERVFIASKFEEAPMLRGVYFTSGTQEGSPIDRVIGQLARAFGVERKLLPVQTSSGKSYFITTLLRGVIFPEQGLAGANLRWERRRTFLQLAAYGAVAVLAILASAAWLTSYTRNKAYVDEVEARVATVRKQVADLPVTGTTDVVGLVPVLEAVRELATTPEIAGGEVPLSMGFGLFQGDKLAAASHQAYRQLLQDALMPRIALRVEEQLRGASPSNLEVAYESLKAYLMLHDPSHFDAAALKTWITFDWERRLPRDFTHEQRKVLEGHLDTLLERGAVTSPVPADQNLIQTVRTMLARYPLANRVYSRLKRQGVGADIPEFTIVKAAGPAAPIVITRASGAPLTKGIPGLFTYDGYYKAFRKESDKVANQLADEEAWVLGLKVDAGALSRVTNPAERARLIEDVRRLYLNDYAKTWEEFLGDIKLVRPHNLQQSIDIARVLSAPDNPLTPLLRAASRETTLVKTEEEKTALDKGVDKLKETTQKGLGMLFGADSPGAPSVPPGERIESIVDRRFDKLRQFVTPAAPGQPAQIDSATALVGELHTMLNAADTALKSKAPVPVSDVPNKIKAGAPAMPEPLGQMLQALSSDGTRYVIGSNKATAIDTIRATVSDFCRKAVVGRYPFKRSSSTDIPQADFVRLFSPGGLMDEAFQKNLADKVDISTKPWSFRKFNDLDMGDASYLIHFQRAAMIRDVFFRGGAGSSGFQLDFKPVYMDASIAQFTLDVHGQLLKYAHGPQVPQSVQWPPAKGSPPQVRVQIQPPGPSGTSGLTTEGSWALFRMFDKMRIEPSSQPERFRAEFVVDGRRAEFEIVVSSVQNPFQLRELEQFQCP